MRIGGTHDAGLQKTVVTIYTHQCLYDESGEAKVLNSILARSMEQYAIVGA